MYSLDDYSFWFSSFYTIKSLKIQWKSLLLDLIYLTLQASYYNNWRFATFICPTELYRRQFETNKENESIIF